MVITGKRANSEALIKARKRICDGSAIICIAGMGYVGSALADAAETKYRAIGFDTDPKRVNATDLRILKKDIKRGKERPVFSNPKVFDHADIIAICVPTPLDRMRAPDLSYIESTARAIGVDYAFAYGVYKRWKAKGSQ
jgi:UDP-N-acetyl-D-mannosaminuronate dehydrogenase